MIYEISTYPPAHVGGLGADLSPYTSPYTTVTNPLFYGTVVPPFFTMNRPGNPTFPFGVVPSTYQDPMTVPKLAATPTNQTPVSSAAPAPTLWPLALAAIGAILLYKAR